MPDEDEFERLARQRQQEAAQRQAKAREQQRAQQERQARLNTLSYQLQLSAAQLVGIAARYDSKLGEVGSVQGFVEAMSCHVKYERTGGTAGVPSARLDFELQESGEVRIRSTLGHSSTKQLSDLTYPVLEAEVRAFLTAALA